MFGDINLVFHIAGHNGGLAFNQDFPADIFVRNTQMGMNVLDACRRFKVEKVVSVVASCAYPEFKLRCVLANATSCTREPHEVMAEWDFLLGEPHDSVACHGYAKRNLQLASSFMKKQYGLNAVCVCPTTLYGPGDSFDPQRTKILGGMVKRFVDAKRNQLTNVTCWGSGEPKREFLYVHDCASLLVKCMEKYGDSDHPLNLGTGQEYSVKEVAETVARCVGYTGKIWWDTSKPDGQLRKRLDLTKMHKVLGEFPFTPFEKGVAETVRAYRDQSRVAVDEEVVLTSRSWREWNDESEFTFCKSKMMPPGKRYRLILEEIDQ